MFTRLQEISADRNVAVALGQFFTTLDTGGRGRLVRDDALKVLSRSLSADLPGLATMSLQMTEAKWLECLKSFGVYGAEDAIALEALLELYALTISSLRDSLAHREVLRDTHRVVRGAPRLKDQYDNFEFRTKDSLGKVYACRDTRTREARSCRQICKNKASVPIEHIRHKLECYTHLQHPSFPQVCTFLEDYHNFYVLSAPVSGIEVMDKIQESVSLNQPLTEAWIAKVMQQVLEVVSFCHSQPLGPVTHRDLKPENIVLSTEEFLPGRFPSVFVTNFGIQALFETQHLTNYLPRSCASISGSKTLPTSSMPEIVAPEVWRRSYGPRCDIWSCGCLLFLLVTGRLPFGPNLSMPDLARLIFAGEPDWRLFRHVSTSALSLCRRMLSRDEMVRPSAWECLRHPWFSSCGDGRIVRELPLDTNVALMQFHANAKLQQVLMNLIAAELKVSDLRRLPSVFGSLDKEGTGVLRTDQFEAALIALGVMPQSVGQVLHAVSAERLDKVPYGFFIAGCADLVDDKLDHMLWKVFSMVDEDHSGEVGVIELEHFLSTACGEVSSPARPSSNTGDIEKYLRSVLDPSTDAVEAVTCMAAGRDVVAFEDLKRYMLEGMNGFAEPSAQDHRRPSLLH
jgi:serine/threonine protein kinase